MTKLEQIQQHARWPGPPLNLAPSLSLLVVVVLVNFLSLFRYSFFLYFLLSHKLIELYCCRWIENVYLRSLARNMEVVHQMVHAIALKVSLATVVLVVFQTIMALIALVCYFISSISKKVKVTFMVRLSSWSVMFRKRKMCKWYRPLPM